MVERRKEREKDNYQFNGKTENMRRMHIIQTKKKFKNRLKYMRQPLNKNEDKKEKCIIIRQKEK